MNDQRRLGDVIGTAHALAADWSRACRDAPLDMSDALPIVELLVDAMAADEVDLDWRLILSTGQIPVPTVSQLRQLRALLFHRASVQGPPGIHRHLDLFLDDLTDKVVEHQLSLVEREALTDALTGVGNRRALERDAEGELVRRARRDEELAVIVIDLDGLKALNDELGHDAGDDALRAIADSFRRAARITDAVYRIGGDEFVVILPDTGSEGAEAVVARAAEDAPPFTYGVAIAPTEGTTPQELVETADRVLVARKRQRHEQGPTAPSAAKADRTIAPVPRRQPTVEPVEQQEHEPVRAPEPVPAPERVQSNDAAVVLRGINAQWEGSRFAVEVVLASGGREERSSATSSAVGAARYRAVAEATLRCLTALGLASREIYLDRADLCRCASVDVASASVLSMSGNQERISFGIGTLQQGTLEGIVFAVIDAVVVRGA